MEKFYYSWHIFTKMSTYNFHLSPCHKLYLVLPKQAPRALKVVTQRHAPNVMAKQYLEKSISYCIMDCAVGLGKVHPVFLLSFWGAENIFLLHILTLKR